MKKRKFELFESGYHSPQLRVFHFKNQTCMEMSADGTIDDWEDQGEDKADE